MKNETKLYNVLFPLWMLLLFPQVWLVVLPGNFIIDSVVLLIGMCALKVENKKEFYKNNILQIFGFGLAADVVGSIYMLVMMTVFEIGTMGDDPYLTLPALILSAILIFVFNYAVTFKKYDKNVRFKLSLTFAIVTAPYTFLVPSTWLYS